MLTDSQPGKCLEPADPAIVGAALRGLHDMAQPLTVLQGSLELALMQVQTADEYRQWLEFALEQAGRLASDLAQVQQLIRLQQPAADMKSFALSSAVRTVLRQFRGTLGAAGINIVLASHGSLEVHSSRSRIEEALAAVFSSLPSLLCRAGRIEVQMEGRSPWVFMRLSVACAGERSSAPASNGNGVAGLNMARALFASVGGELKFTQDPLWLEISLPRSRAKRTTKISKKGDSIHV